MTNVEEVSSLLHEYREWLKERTSLKRIDSSWIQVNTPFLDRHNDYIQIYIRKQEGTFILSDGGETIQDLEISGCSLDTPKRKQLMRMALNGFGADLKHNQIVVKASSENFASRKHALVQAILAINDLFYTASSVVESLFKEDVAQWLEQYNIRYLPDVQFVGQSGYTHNFDFAIPRSKRAPERLLKAINIPNKDIAQSFIFAWLDTRSTRPEDAKAFAVLNDRKRDAPPTIIDAFGNYDIQPILWSYREEKREELAM